MMIIAKIITMLMINNDNNYDTHNDDGDTKNDNDNST